MIYVVRIKKYDLVIPMFNIYSQNIYCQEKMRRKAKL